MEYEIAADEPVGTAVVRAVCAATGRDSGSLRPLGTVVDPPALAALFAPREDGTPRTGGRLSFVYGGCRVTLENGEYVVARPLGERRGPADGTGALDGD